MTHPKHLYTVREAAQLLSLGQTLLYELISRGELQSVKIGKARRIPAAALDAFVERLRADQAA